MRWVYSNKPGANMELNAENDTNCATCDRLSALVSQSDKLAVHSASSRCIFMSRMFTADVCAAFPTDDVSMTTDNKVQLNYQTSQQLTDSEWEKNTQQNNAARAAFVPMFHSQMQKHKDIPHANILSHS